MLVLCFEGCRVHCYQNITLVAWCEYLVCSNVYLEARNAGEHALRSAYVGRVVGECTDIVSDSR